MLDTGDSVGLIACSDGISPDKEEIIHEVENNFYDMGIKTVRGTIFRPELGVAIPAKERAGELMNMYTNPEIKAIFDVSGGDVANEVLEYLDYDVIKEEEKSFFGYSDLTTVINAIYHKTGVPSYLYQVRNVASEHGERQMADLIMTLKGESDDLCDIEYDFIRGNKMEGVVIGGNLRCFLKLTGTGYMPSFRHKILFLESFGGGEARVRTYFRQLKQMGAFEEVNGVLLGTYTELEAKGDVKASDIFMEICDNPEVPVAVTRDVGHGAGSKAIIIGKEIQLED